jgi:signal transduction histidine kinase
MATRMREMAWTRTPFGPAATWPQPLQTAVNICLSSRFPIVLWWGPELRLLYNDAWPPALGALKHPALARPGREVWPEIWHIIGPMLESVLTTGEATWSDDQLLPMNRFGYLEETYWTFSYGPIRLEDGTVGGVFTSVNETTARVLGERRTRAARDLAATLVNARTAEEVARRATEALARDVPDVPFALLYLIDHGHGLARLAGASGIERGHPLAPALIDLTTGESDANGGAPRNRSPWPVAEVARAGQRTIIDDVAERATNYAIRDPQLDLDLTPNAALVLPITGPGQSAPSAILVAGVSPRRALDDSYEGFFDLLASHLSSALASAHAYEAERQRFEALEEIDRAKTIFFSNVSHEFRTPLTLMLGPLEDILARDGSLPRDVRSELEVVQRNGLRLLKLVNSLLDFARIEAGRVQAVYEPTDLAQLTADLASSFRSLVERAGLAFVVDCPPWDSTVSPLFYVDREMWEKIVLNLLSNAFKFTFTGEIRVALRLADDGRQVKLVVRDTGVGIPAAELPRLFERFHRIPQRRSRSYEGTGIGLALVQELVHLHGGTIAVTSAEGQGTTFTVTIPTGTAHLPAERIQAKRPDLSTALGMVPYVEEARRWLIDGELAPEDENGALPWLRADRDDTATPMPPAGTDTARARILLADDNADLRHYLSRLLEERYTVEAVPNGAAALAAARARTPDLVLADVMMPELDGVELLRALRADPRTKLIPVILLSARAGEEATVEGLSFGADDYLVKPFSGREILARIASHLEIARLRQDALVRAEENTRRMDEFLGIASHELRTPLTSITANIQMAQRQLDLLAHAATGTGGESRTTSRLERSAVLVERAARQLTRLDRLVGDLLDTSRAQAGKLELRREPCDLLAIARDAVNEQRPAWPNRDLSLDLPPVDHLLVDADADRIGQVVTNYLTNALKYSPADAPVRTRVRLDDGIARVEVRDLGPGITPEQQAHLFERFYRVPGIEQQTGSGVGLGLGLHICKAIVERHGGTVGVDSAPGTGSTFWFTLPVLAEASE